MGDPSMTQTQNFYSTLGVPKTASLTDISKAYKFLVKKWHPDRNPTNKAEAEAKFRSINEAYRVLSVKKREEANNNAWNTEHEPNTPKKKNPFSRQKANEEPEFHISNPTLLSRTTSRISPAPIPVSSKSSSKRSPTISPKEFYAAFEKVPTSGSGIPSTPNDTPVLSKAKSRRSPTPIFFSQSAARRKPQPIEKKLLCTLEELCYGCVKKIKITRDVISSTGLIVQDEEILTIKVKPGWKKGTKITFEEKGDEKPGTLPADIIFSIAEKRHPVFKREGDDLELGVSIPLVQALTGCSISVPLLGGVEMNMSIDDVIYPGYEKIIPGQGMPISKEKGRRGNLRLKFLVEFPYQLSSQQRSQVACILEHCS